MLLGLEQGTVTVQPPELDEPAIFSGPLVRDVLGTVEATRRQRLDDQGPQRL